MTKLRSGEHNTTVALCDEDRERIDNRIHGVDSRAQWFRTAAEMRLELEEAAEAAGGDLPDGWWRDELYDAMRAAAERRVHEDREAESAEADD